MPVSCWIYVVLGEIPSLSILQQLLLHNTFGRVLGIDGGTKINISLDGQPTLMEELKHKRKQKCSDDGKISFLIWQALNWLLWNANAIIPPVYYCFLFWFDRHSQYS